MKTLKATGPLLYSARTDKMPGVPQGKVHVRCVRYETYEMDDDEFDKTTFTVNDAASPDARNLAALSPDFDNLLDALRAVILANAGLSGMSGNKVTYYEESPTKNAECARRWLDLNNALSDAKKLVRQLTKDKT